MVKSNITIDLKDYTEIKEKSYYNNIHYKHNVNKHEMLLHYTDDSDQVDVCLMHGKERTWLFSCSDSDEGLFTGKLGDFWT